MESMGAIAEREWSSLSGSYTTEEADFMAQLLGTYPVEEDSSSGVPSATTWPRHGSSPMNMTTNYSFDIANNTNSFSFLQGSSSYSACSSILFPSSSHESYFMSHSNPILATNNGSISMDFCMGDATNTGSYLIEGDDRLNLDISDGNGEEAGKNQKEPVLSEKNLQPKMESEAAAENSKKRSRSTGDAQKNKRNVKSRKNHKSVISACNNEEDTNGGLNRQSSSSCCSEDDSNASQEINNGGGGATSSMNLKGTTTALNSNGKTRASRGAATDPQSLYARKRRERINERLRILQNLVPNGTKVDISTMLEEAVHYVKFLQLQIKLLSSDDLWMYAPIAYNGMDIGLDLKLNTQR